MALVRGTNCGFVSSSPSADPGGTGGVIDNYAIAFKDTSPSDSVKITEIGWYCDNATEEANYEVAIYDHDSANDRAGNIIGSYTTNAKGTGAGWKKVTGLDITIAGSTIYWISVQLDNTATQTNTDIATTGDAGDKYKYHSVATLPDPWTADTGFSNRFIAIYAVYSTTSVDYTQHPNCIAAYLFKEGSGTTVADSSAETNTGNFKGAGEPAWYNSSLPKAYIDYAADFDGANDYINCGTDTSFDDPATNGEVTITAWINVTAFPSGDNRYIAGYGYDGSNESFRLRLQESGGTVSLNCGAYDGSEHFASWDISGWSTGNWHHVACVYDGTDWLLYFDGVEKPSATNTGPESVGASVDFSIGAFNQNGSMGRYINARITEVGVFSTGLSSTDINSIMNYGLDGSGDSSDATVIQSIVY